MYKLVTRTAWIALDQSDYLYFTWEYMTETLFNTSKVMRLIHYHVFD